MDKKLYAPHAQSPFMHAFKLSLPVLLSYFPLGLVFGALFAKLHTHWFMAPIMSFFAYSGAVQFVSLGLIQQKASYWFIAVSVFFVAGRNIFYGLSLLDRYKMPWFKKLLSIFLLVDPNYALMLKVPQYNDRREDNNFCLWLGFFLYSYWVAGSLVGALLGDSIPGVNNLEFVLVAFFAIMLLEQYRKNRSVVPIVIGILSFAAALLLVSASSLLLFGILLSGVLLVIYDLAWGKAE